MLHYKLYNKKKDEWVVLIHGISADLNVWKPQIKDLIQHYNLLLLELPWHGGSGNDEFDTYSLSENIKRILDKEDIASAHFVGMSLGSLVTSQFAIQFPQYVKNIVFVSAVIQTKKWCSDFVMAANPFRKLVPYKLLSNTAITVVTPNTKDTKYYQHGFERMTKEGFCKWAEYLKLISKGKEYTETLRQKGRQMFFISGRKDNLFLEGAQSAAKMLNAPMYVMEGCTHNCNSDNPKVFNRALLKFLQCPQKEGGEFVCII